MKKKRKSKTKHDFIEMKSQECTFCDAKDLAADIVNYVVYAVRMQFEGKLDEYFLFMARAMRAALAYSVDEDGEFNTPKVNEEDMDYEELIIHHTIKFAKANLKDPSSEDSEESLYVLVHTVYDYIVTKYEEDYDWES